MKNFFKGIVVGLGGVAPGLSGSVLLVIFKLYQKTITAISSTIKDALAFIVLFFKNIKNPKALKGSKELKSILENLKFLIPLVIGIGIGVVLFSTLVDTLLNTFPAYTRFAFLGLILGTLPLFYREVKKEGFNNKYYIIMAVALAFGLVLMNISDITPVTDPNLLQSMTLGFCVAASSIVPGIDSAAILTALGLYGLYVSSIASFDFAVLLPAGVGLAVGVLVISFAINKLLSKYYTLTFSVLFGLFISIIPEVVKDESCYALKGSQIAIAVVLLVVGFIFSLVFSNLEVIVKKNDK